MTPEDYLTQVRADAAGLQAAARQDFAATIPTCPGWAMPRLIAHVGQVHQWVTEIVGTRAQEVVDFRSLPAPPDGEAVIEWFGEGVDRLCSTLTDAGPDAAVWSWGPVAQRSAFWFRRMAEETAVHRWDGQNALGPATPLPTGLAVDGVEEMFDSVVPRARTIGPFRDGGATMHIHATDTEGEWLVALDGTTVEMTHGHAKGDAAVRGTASDLLLFLWKRLDPEAPALEVFGDPSVLVEWREKTRF